MAEARGGRSGSTPQPVETYQDKHPDASGKMGEKTAFRVHGVHANAALDATHLAALRQAGDLRRRVAARMEVRP